MLPTAHMYPPVSVGELPTHDYQVSAEIITEEVSTYLELHPEIPGVIIFQGNKIHSIIPRGKLFERLGHRYGIELFFSKPIVEIQENLKTTIAVISSNTRIHTAVGIALARAVHEIYDPLVIKHDDGSYHLLDVHVLLLSQSLVMENMNNIVTNMNRIEQSIKADIPLDASLDMILDAVKRTTPYHRATILIKPNSWMKTFSHHDLFHPISESLSSHPLIKSIWDTRIPIHIENTNVASMWEGMNFAGKTSVWVGLPIASGGNMEGILSLSRKTDTPFSKNEIDMARTFSEFLCVAINKTVDGHDDRQFAEMIQRKFIY